MERVFKSRDKCYLLLFRTLNSKLTSVRFLNIRTRERSPIHTLNQGYKKKPLIIIFSSMHTSGRQCPISPPSLLSSNHPGQRSVSTSNPALRALFQSETIDPGPCVRARTTACADIHAARLASLLRSTYHTGLTIYVRYYFKKQKVKTGIFSR